MKDSMFSRLVSITKGLHREKSSEKEFQLLLSDLKVSAKADNAVFKVNFKRPLNSKKAYYEKCISNETENTIVYFVKDFPENATIAENEYSYTILNNKFDKYLNDISVYINTRNIGADLSSDDDYIINYLKISAIRLYAELQEQYGQFSDRPIFTVSELAEKYFNDPKFDNSIIEKLEVSKSTIHKKVAAQKRKSKTSFSFKNSDTSQLLTVLKQLHLKIDLLDNRTTVEQLFQVLTAKDYSQINTVIYLQCETTQFSYVVSKLKPYFISFNPTSIERSGKFITKTGIPLKANNLHKNKVHNPKEKEEIDNIIQKLQ